MASGFPGEDRSSTVEVNLDRFNRSVERVSRQCGLAIDAIGRPLGIDAPSFGVVADSITSASKALLKYQLHNDQELLDKAYRYIRQYY
jgi:hypothetical protein